MKITVADKIFLFEAPTDGVRLAEDPSVSDVVHVSDKIHLMGFAGQTLCMRFLLTEPRVETVLRDHLTGLFSVDTHCYFDPDNIEELLTKKI